LREIKPNSARAGKENARPSCKTNRAKERDNMSVLARTDSERKQIELPDTDYLLAAIRSGGLRVRLLSNQLDAIGISLKRGMITPAAALEWINQIDAWSFLFPEIGAAP
jgi:hypothetical protein